MDEYATSLTVPTKLFLLHTGRAGNVSALSPAIVLLVISAFEGFAQNLFAGALFEDNLSLGQIADRLRRWNNPTLRDLQRHLETAFPGVASLCESSKVDEIRPFRKGLYGIEAVKWDQALQDADAWMQVRHALSHGEVSGWRTQRWPIATSSRNIITKQERRILYSGKSKDRQSITLPVTRSCCALYVCGAQRLADAVAAHFTLSLNWNGFKEFFLAASHGKSSTSPIPIDYPRLS